MPSLIKIIVQAVKNLRVECRAKGNFSRLWTDFDAVFFLFESYLDCKSKEVRNNGISLGEF